MDAVTMESALVVGTGLIGTSAALALKARGVAVHLRDADPAAVRIASSLGAGTVEAPRQSVDLAVVAVPPALVTDVLVGLQADGVARHYTDVASVKSGPQQEALARDCDTARYVGGHPMAGSERSGPLAARADLFVGCNWVLTPTPDADTETLNTTLELVALCGAVPVVMEADVHDRAVGLVSHAPHVVASLVAALLERAEERAVRLAGSGVQDLTRIAAADPGLWVDILGANALVVADLLEELSGGMDDAVAGLRAMAATDEEKREGGARTVEDLLRRGRSGRARIPAKRGILPEQYETVTIEIGDQPGELARLFTDASRAGVNVEDVRLEHSAGQPAGLVHLSVARDLMDVLTTELRNGEWRRR
ncbi:prephenate dehydrogenase [Streptomyces sp. NBC_00006]|uniref:prephenate dehydrogenase n=1 Tax=unclassified Streptomyces TaxID=2593676 RepID=UPI00225215BF|nr:MULTISPECIES: prephenate dehydrogenase [unclassified Streptomyces]MCX5536352.1 prephenate dehydrogenase [Streptomyces sp. NBC_00006]